MGDIWRCARRSLFRKWSRTLLTVSGILVGVLMVVVVSFISDAGTSSINSELEKLGMSGLSISAGNTTEASGLSSEHLEAIRQFPTVESAMPLLLEFAAAESRDIVSETVACGIDAGANQVISLELAHGRMLNPGDIQRTAHVCVVDQSVARKTYGRENITGKHITLTIAGIDETFEIVGVAKTGSSLLQNFVEYIPGLVYIPYTTLQNLSGRSTFDQIAVRVAPGEDAEQVEERLIETLERSTGLNGFFEAENLAMQKERLDRLLEIVTLILTAISGISLLVSGMGIMTIMLVSVNERVREIGVKKAIGATRGRILLEFLTESVLLSLLGGIAGIGLGVAAGWAGMTAFGISFSLPLPRLLGLLGFTILIGAVFGVYPAVKASRLRPVEALRTE